MLVNVINTFDTDFIIPVSYVDKNMKRAHEREALIHQKFWFKVKQPSFETINHEENKFLGNQT